MNAVSKRFDSGNQTKDHSDVNGALSERISRAVLPWLSLSRAFLPRYASVFHSMINLMFSHIIYFIITRSVCVWSCVTNRTIHDRSVLGFPWLRFCRRQSNFKQQRTTTNLRQRAPLVLRSHLGSRVSVQSSVPWPAEMHSVTSTTGKKRGVFPSAVPGRNL